MRRHGAIAYIKNKLVLGNRIDFVRKSAHEKNINIDFMANVWKHVMKNMMSPTHKHELQLVFLLKGYVSVMRLLFGRNVAIYNKYLCNK